MTENFICCREPGWDGTDELASPLRPSKKARRAYLNSSQRKIEMANNGIKDEVAREDASGSDYEDLTVSNERNLTRQEVKQLDREIPWREIWSQPYMVKEKYIEAASNEFSGWTEWSSIRPLTQKQADEIRADPQQRRRILRSRAAYRDKNKGLGHSRARCRVVLIGCQDPDLTSLTRSQPTPSCTALCGDIQCLRPGQRSTSLVQQGRQNSQGK